MAKHTELYLKVQMGELLFVYLLYIFLVTAPIGFLISVGKMVQYRYFTDVEDEDEERVIQLFKNQHFWLLQTFFVTLLMAMAALGTAYYFFGYLIAIGAIFWWIYRLGRGLVMLIESRSVYVPSRLNLKH